MRLFFPLLAFLLVNFPVLANCQEPRFTQPIPDRFPELFYLANTSNVYLLKKDGHGLLINTGASDLENALRDVGVAQVDLLLLNNHHRENIQAIRQTSLQQTQIYASEMEAEILTSPIKFRKWYPQLSDRYSVYGASFVRPPARPIRVDRKLEDGDIVIWRGLQLRCLSTPGHSPGELSFLISKGDDTFAFSGGLMYDGSRFTNWFDSEWDYGFAAGIDAILRSVGRLSEANVDVMLPVQGPIVLNAREQLATYRERLESFREKYIRGYPVFDKDPDKRDRVSQPTQVPHLNQVTPHLYKLNDDFQGRNFSILVSDSGHGLILDCGLFPQDVLEEIIVGLRQHMGLKQIDAYWISHMHGDHFLHGPFLKEKYGAEAWTLDKIVDRCENPRRYDYAALVSAYGDGFDGMKIDKAFQDGESITWEGYKIQVDWLPGQTEFGCCLWLDIDDKRIAFTGDNLFGDPRDRSQTAHDCVVARNSAILAEGHVHGSQYLLKLNPDIIMAAHSYVMPDPQELLQRYHAWSKDMQAAFQQMLPDQDYEYLFDPYWVSAYPYRIDLSDGKSHDVMITVRNFRKQDQHHRVELILPEGVTAQPKLLVGSVSPKSRQEFKVTLTADTSQMPEGVQIIPLDITLDGKQYGQWFDFLIGNKP
ncbi:MBL fold metallo-hydrolase [Bremerella sp. T1]|uniref:MBL fold metallo-hydrolase n=1 Tax=Bremerella sp. TYQ1 TaxID=3119568 RepID=UPI001CC9095E|nr:MBL fold metallo-hydrolase [Bremerella volcania]UBM36880.1 MBL fold metallo-hydrolase [Bremerella volcania]